VNRLLAPKRRFEAQKATLRMLSELADEEPQLKEHEEAKAAKVSPRSRTKRLSMMAKESAEVRPLLGITCSSDDFATSQTSFGSGLMASALEEEPSPVAIQDPEVRAWAENELGLTASRLEGLEMDPPLRAKLGHQMLCWPKRCRSPWQSCLTAAAS